MVDFVGWIWDINAFWMCFKWFMGAIRKGKESTVGMIFFSCVGLLSFLFSGLSESFFLDAKWSSFRFHGSDDHQFPGLKHRIV